MSKHLYEISGEYRGGLAGTGRLTAKSFEVAFSAPKDLGGAGEGTNPEELFGAAANACYLITLHAIFQFQKIEGITVSNSTQVEVEVSQPGNLKITRLRHFPRVKGLLDSAAKDRVFAALNRAEEMCVVGNTVRNNIEISIHPRFEEGK